MRYKFQNTFCSQCGEEFGPGDHGFSSCKSHWESGMKAEIEAHRRITEALAKAKNAMLEATRVAEEQQMLSGIWKKLDTMTGKIESLQATIWGTK
jgi:hypothetical protein